jgi:hypothetical protein
MTSHTLQRTEPPSPLSERRLHETVPVWPAHAVADDFDVTIAGLSLLRLVEWAGTPCVHNCEAEPTASESGRQAGAMSSVVVARVLSVSLSAVGAIEVTIDAELGGCRPVFDEVRVIGRDSHCARFDMLVISSRPGSPRFAVGELPGDLREGDLLVFPCVGVSTLHDIRVDSPED